MAAPGPSLWWPRRQLRARLPMIGRLSPRRRRAAATADGAEPTARTPDAATPADAATRLLPPATEQATAVQAAAPGLPSPGAEVALPPLDPATPAGLEVQPPLDPGVPVPGWRHRGRLRRRLRYLRRVRELGFRDLGGLAFDLHRFGRDGRELVRVKLEALGTVDTELRVLEQALDDRREYVELREPGITACPRCAALHASDARFCPGCGLHLDGPMPLAEVGDAPGSIAAPSPGEAAAPSTTPAPDATADVEPAGGGVRAVDTGSSPVSSGLGPLSPAPAEQSAAEPAASAPPRTPDRPPSGP